MSDEIDEIADCSFATTREIGGSVSIGRFTGHRAMGADRAMVSVLIRNGFEELLLEMPVVDFRRLALSFHIADTWLRWLE